MCNMYLNLESFGIHLLRISSGFEHLIIFYWNGSRSTDAAAVLSKPITSKQLVGERLLGPVFGCKTASSVELHLNDLNAST